MQFTIKKKRRGYADFFGSEINRDLEEQGVVNALAESLEINAALFFSDISIRGRGNDPPDLEARDTNGRRIAFEVTELVDGSAIQTHKSGRKYDFAEWSREKFLTSLTSLLNAKNKRFIKLKDAPYHGGYVIVVFTDETALPRATVEAYLQGHTFSGISNVNKAFLLLSYDPLIKRYPYFELRKDS